MDQVEFKRRTKAFAIGVITVTDNLPRPRSGEVIGRQLLRSATSVGANYRAACRARSPQEMYSKLSIVEEEADECLYWFELLQEAGLASNESVIELNREAHEILSMIVASKKTLSLRLNGSHQSAIGNRQSTIERRES